MFLQSIWLANEETKRHEFKKNTTFAGLPRRLQIFKNVAQLTYKVGLELGFAQSNKETFSRGIRIVTSRYTVNQQNQFSINLQLLNECYRFDLFKAKAMPAVFSNISLRNSQRCLLKALLLVMNAAHALTLIIFMENEEEFGIQKLHSLDNDQNKSNMLGQFHVST